MSLQLGRTPSSSAVRRNVSFSQVGEEVNIVLLLQNRNVILLNTSLLLKCAGSFPNELFRIQRKTVTLFLNQKGERTPQKQFW